MRFELESSSVRGSKGRLTRLKINRFRSVVPGVELHFDDGMNVFVGRNGTGKTTLLELIAAVVAGDLRAYEAEGFDLEFDVDLAGERVSVSVRNEVHGTGSLPAWLGDAEESRSWRYEILFQHSSGISHRIEVVNGVVRHPLASDLEDSPEGEARLFVPEFYVRSIKLALGIKSTDFTGLSWPHRLIANSCIRLDEGLDIFRSMTNGVALPHLGKPLSVVLFSGFPWGNPEGGTRRLLEMLSLYAPAPLFQCLLDHGEGAQQETELSVSSEQWELLRVLETMLGVKDVRLTMQLIERKSAEGVGADGMSIFGKPIFRVTTNDGVTFMHDRLSYGEKRLIVFLYHAAANPSVLVADELVNGLHHEWIQTCLDAIEGQAFLSSQNPLLLDHLSFSSPKDVQSRFISCSSGNERTWTWRNMEPDDAAAFFRAYEVGIQHVSDILRTKGLW